MTKKKFLALLIVFFSFLLFFLILTNLYFTYKELTMTKDIDYNSIHELHTQINNLYKELNKKEIEIKKHEYDFKTKNFLINEYNALKSSIDEKKQQINNSLKGTTKVGFKNFLLHWKTLFSLFILLVLLLWNYYIIKGMLIGYSKSKKLSNLFEEQHSVNKNQTNYNLREDIEEIYASSNSTKNENSNIEKDNLSFNTNLFDNITTSASSENKEKLEEEKIDFWENIKKLDSDTSIEEPLETTNQTIYNNEIISENEYTLQQELKTKLKIKQKEERLKKLMKNPKVEMIINFYKKGDSIFTISEYTGLSKDEVKFVINMWETFMKDK